MNTERPESIVGEGSPTDTREPHQSRVRAGVVLAVAVAIPTGVFAVVAELVLHRWLQLYSTSITGAVWLFFGACWSDAAMRRLRSNAPIATQPPVWPARQILAAYRATLPRVASLAFVVIALAGVVDRLWRA